MIVVVSVTIPNIKKKTVDANKVIYLPRSVRKSPWGDFFWPLHHNDLVFWVTILGHKQKTWYRK